MPKNVNELIDQVDGLLVSFARAADEHRDDIESVHPTHRNGAENLVHYADLRSRDLRHLQQALTELGATSLSAPEADTRAKVMSVRNVLGALSNGFQPYFGEEIANALATADNILEANALRLLGPSPDDMPGRIMVTLPSEAATDAALVLSFAEAGMDLARINCAHDGPAAWEQMIAHVHTAARTVGREIKISMDLAGPKLRTGAIAPGPHIGRSRVMRLESGKVLTPARIWLVRKPLPGEQVAAAPQLPGRPVLTVHVDSWWLETLQVDDKISLHDARGLRRHFIVEARHADGVLATGDRNAYIAEGSLLECNFEKTRVAGIPALEQRLHLEAGDQVILRADPEYICRPDELPLQVGCTLPLAVQSLQVGDEVLFDDGAISAEVASTTSAEAAEDAIATATLTVTRTKPGGQKLAAFKGINLPTTELPLPALTPEDEEHLAFVARHADIAAISFVRSPEDVEHVLGVLQRLITEAEQAGDHALAARTAGLGIALKIETIPGFRLLPQILLAGMAWENLGVMIARGDLAVELGFERLSEVPLQIIALAEAAHIPTILATQVLESAAKTGLPSRAEITDAAVALRAECVMLNKGPHIVQAMSVLHRIGRKIGKAQRKSRILMRHIHSWDD